MLAKEQLLIFSCLSIFSFNQAMSLIFEGTLIATFITKNKIYLLSDGRVINKIDGTIRDDWSKIHKINNRVGMLVAGIYVPNLRDDIIRNCRERDLTSVKDVANISSLILQEIWNQYTANPEYKEKIKNIRIFVFLVGFDENNVPHMFFLDNMSEPRFKLQEKALFEVGDELEIGAMSYASGETENPSGMLIKYLTPYINSKGKQIDLKRSIYSAFNSTKKELAEKTQQIGGKTFFAEIDIKNGYKDL